MGGGMAALRERFRRKRAACTLTARQISVAFDAKMLTASSNANQHPPFGMCGMRIAAQARRAPAWGSGREPIEEVA